MKWAIGCCMCFGIAATNLAAAESVYKCVDASGTAYQSTPCRADAVETRLAAAEPGPRAAGAAREIAPASTQTRRAWRRSGPWKHTALALGISDDEVLNMPGWGRPSRINRTRLPRQWHEEWIYEAGLVAEQRLYFVNAKLVDFVVVPLPDRLVQAGAQPPSD